MQQKIILFGGSGFIGKALTHALLNAGYHTTVICQQVEKAQRKLPNSPLLTIKHIDITDKATLASTIASFPIVINLIGKLYEQQSGDFARYHTQFPKLLAESIPENTHLIHISSLGIERACQDSLYAKTKLAGENAIKERCKQYSIIRPSVVFGPEDQFFNLFATISKISPCIPLIGGGHTKFSPVYVGDLVNGILALIEQGHTNTTYAAVGPDVSTFKELMVFMLKTRGAKRLLIPVPFALATSKAYIMNMLGIYLLTPDQVALLRHDNVNDANLPSLDACTSYQEIVPQYLR